MIWLIGNRGMLGNEVEELLQERKMRYIASDKEVDVTNQDQLQEFVSDKSLSWIINCSAYTTVDKAEDEIEHAFRINANGPCNIAQIANDKGAKLIHISTDYVFDGTKEGAYKEMDTPNPLNVYGRSKYQGEVNIQRTLEEDFILRTPWLYGKRGNNFVYTMLRLFNERDEVRVVGDQYGSPTNAPDLAEVLLKMINLNSEAYGIYHFANKGKISWYDFGCEIYRIGQKMDLLTKNVLIKHIVTSDYLTKAQRPQNSYLSKEKIKSTYKIAVRPWQSGLQEFLIGQNSLHCGEGKI